MLVVVFTVRIILFLCGSNYHGGVVGWTSVSLIVADISVLVVFMVYRLAMARRGRSRIGRV